MRLFVAINLPDDVRRAVDEAVEVVRERDMPARWTDPGQYHVTLKFIGEVRPDRRDDHVEVLRRIGERLYESELRLSDSGGVTD